MFEMPAWVWIVRSVVALSCVATACLIAWRQMGGDWIFIALVALIAGCSVMTAGV